MAESITLQLPDRLYQRLTHMAQAIQRPREEVIVRALEVGAPPNWDDVPTEFQADLAAILCWRGHQVSCCSQTLVIRSLASSRSLRHRL